MDSVLTVIAQLVGIVLQYLPKDSDCPICEARAKAPAATEAAVIAANVAADALEAEKFGK